MTHFFSRRGRVLLLLALPFAAQAQSGVGIGTTAPDASAGLDVVSSSKGALLPRLTSAQRTAIARPATGLLVFQTNAPAGFYFNGGTPAAPVWRLVGTTAAGDNLGNHLATQALNLAGNALVGTGTSLGTRVGLGVTAAGGLNIGQNATGNNVYLGYLSGAATPTGGTNTFVGVRSGAATTTGANNTFAGTRSGQATTGGANNTFAGAGSGLLNSTGSNNTFVGTSSGRANTTGGGNVFAGGNSGTANTGGTSNVFVGQNSGQANTSGTGNTFTGTRSGATNTTGNSNTAVGNLANVATGTLSNATALGNGAVVSASNKIRFGNSAVTVIEGQVAYSFPSDARFKYDVRANVPGLAFVTRLRPVTYRFDGAKLDRFVATGALPVGSPPDTTAPVQTGFLAQDVEAAARAVGFSFDGVHAPANARDHYSLAYSQFVMPLVRAVQEQQAQIEALQRQNGALQAGSAADHASLLTLQAQLARLLGEAAPAGAQARK